jgi:hypothetical protein
MWVSFRKRGSTVPRLSKFISTESQRTERLPGCDLTRVSNVRTLPFDLLIIHCIACNTIDQEQHSTCHHSITVDKQRYHHTSSRSTLAGT